MMPFLAIRCLNCNNVDEFPRMDYDEIPYCSQCASTTNLVPATPKETQWTPDDLSALFSATTLNPPTPPTSPPVNYSITQHYTHPTSLPQPTPEDKAYIQYLLTSNLGSASSSNDLEIALAHGIITREEYEQGITANNTIRAQTEREQGEMEMEDVKVKEQLYREMGRGLEEECDALSLLSAAGQQRDPVFRNSEFFNDYYGGGDVGWGEDEEAPCVVGTGGRLRPFDL